MGGDDVGGGFEVGVDLTVVGVVFGVVVTGAAVVGVVVDEPEPELFDPLDPLWLPPPRLTPPMLPLRGSIV